MHNKIVVPGPVDDGGYALWCIEYEAGARLADIRCSGTVVDCVQVRDWDFSLNEQVSNVPTVSGLRAALSAYLVGRGE